MPLVLIHADRFVDHQTPPGHPESPERGEVMNNVAVQWQRGGGEVVAPREATREQLLRVHTDDYVRAIAATKGRAVALDPDTYTSPESYEIACLAAGAGVDAVERTMAASGQPVFALVRPPGHHAERHKAMGFCLFNNIAVAAAHARASGAARVAIVDYDVHHGNGTQHMFDEDPSVLYISMHQYPFYPGTGAADEVGRGPGRGFTVNLPLEVGAVDEDYRLVFAEVVMPVVSQFRPDLVLVSAGFDAHERDPLAGMRLTVGAFAAMTGELRDFSAATCQGRLAVMTEGGYDLRALEQSMDAVAGVMAGGPAKWPAPSSVLPSRGRVAAQAARHALSTFWDW